MKPTSLCSLLCVHQKNVSSKSAYDMKNIPNALLLLPVLPVSMTTTLWVLFGFLGLGLRV